MQPNFLFLLPDQHRPDWLGVNQGLSLRTPNLDGLAGAGVRFTRAVCPSPLCAPARACLAAGRDYPAHGVRNNGQDYPLDQPTYYQALREAGYRVAGVGKFDLHKATLDWSLDGSRCLAAWGFTEGIDSEGKLDGSTSYRRFGGPRGPYLKFLHDRGLAETYLREHAEGKKHMGAYTTALPEEAYGDNWVAQNGLRFLRDFPTGRPWHLVVNFPGPHNPMDVTAAMRKTVEDRSFPLPHADEHPDRQGLLRVRQNYAAMVENIDRHVGRFLDVVRQRGETDRTVVIYASDHGEMLGDHGRWGKSTYYMPSVGIPLIVAAPGGGQGVVSEDRVVLHDLTATMLDYAGCDGLPGMTAQSLRPVLEGRRKGHRPYVLSGLNEWRMVWDGRYKLVLTDRQPPILFDLRDDPWEDRNVAEHQPALVARMTALLTSGEPSRPIGTCAS